MRTFQSSLFAFIALSNFAVAEIQVAPEQTQLNGPLDRLQLQVTATNDNGRPIDRTRSARYESLSPEIVTVSDRGEVQPLADGEGKIRIETDAGAAEVTITVTGMTDNPPVSFRNDVTPVFSKAGCNGGGCHAAQYGQAGFKLSLFGFAPEQDWPELVRDERQRRISLLRPEESLFLKKATMAVGHGGGKRFAADSYEHEILTTWLLQQAPQPNKNDPRIIDLTVTPTEREYDIDQSQQLRVVAHYSDGSTRDVTKLAMYDSLSDGVARVDADGFITAVGHGQAAIMIRFQGQAKVSHVISLYSKNVDLTGFEPNNYIDEHMKSRWQRLGVAPVETCSDEVFIRRAFLDSIGTMPTPERIEQFVASTETDKREQLVDELLGLTGDPKRDRYVDDWSAYWALKWGDLLRNNRNKLGDGGMWALYNWMRAALRENMPVDQFVSEIITAQGSIFSNGPANYYKIATKPEDLAETTAQVFLGVRMQCAKCHHHPFEVYSQADYYGLAAFFTRVGTKSSPDFGALGGDTVVRVTGSGGIRHPRTRQTMSPTPLGGDPIDADDVRDLRRPLADWLTSKENELFARNIVNRVWGYYMGTGLVEPIDDMRATNPPSNPELLDALAESFVQSGFDLRRLMRDIMISRVYQLNSTPHPDHIANTRLYLHYNVKRLPAEVLLDAIDFACGTQERFSGVPLGTRAIELPDPNYTSYFLDTLGRPTRVIACECERTAEPNLAQVLHIANGDLINKKLQDKNGRVARLLKAESNEVAAIAEFYLTTLSRRPTEEELNLCREIISRAPNRKEGFEDVLWALLNSREFLFNH